VVNEDEYIFIAFEGPSRVEYDVHVLEGPNVDVFLMDEDNFRLYAVDAWANSAWRVIDQGSKQGTRRAWARLRVGPGLWFLVVDNRADDYDVLPSGPASGPALLHLSFNTSSATILVPPDSDKKPPSGDDASPGDDGGGVADKNARADRSIVVRSAPVLRWSLLLFFAALPGWPLWRHYSIMVEYAGGCGPAGGLWAWLPFVACAGAAAALPLATLEQSLHRMLQSVTFLRRFPPLLTLLDALFAVALPEEAVKWVIAILTLPVVTYGKRGRGAYLLHGATVAIAFALVENLYYGFGFDVLSSSSPFDTLFIRGITSIPSHVVGGVIMGCLLYRATSWWGFIKALVVPMFLHTIYDYPILLAHQGLFDKDILYMYLLLLLYLEDSIAHHLVLDPQGQQQQQQQQQD
jgi:RsiW-degrading membrane proteinase PrsW (M82 family)